MPLPSIHFFPSCLFAIRFLHLESRFFHADGPTFHAGPLCFGLRMGCYPYEREKSGGVGGETPPSPSTVPSPSSFFSAEVPSVQNPSANPGLSRRGRIFETVSGICKTGPAKTAGAGRSVQTWGTAGLATRPMGPCLVSRRNFLGSKFARAGNFAQVCLAVIRV